MKSLFLLLALSLGLSACTSLKPGCIIEDKLTEVATNTITEKLQCVGKSAIQADMKALVGGLGMCKAQQTGMVADAVCPLLVSTVVMKLKTMAIPSEWQCSAVDAKVFLTEHLTNACKMIPVSDFQK